MSKQCFWFVGGLLVLVGSASYLLAQPGRDDDGPRPGPGAGFERSRDMLASRPTSRPASRPARPAAITPDQEKEVLDFIQQKLPVTWKQFEQMREASRAGFRQARLHEMLGWYQRYKDAPEAVQSAMIVEQENKLRMWRAAQEVQQAADDAQRAERMKALTQIVGEYFDAQQKIREYRITELEQQVKHLRDELKTSGDNRQKEVQERTDGLIRLAASRPASQPGAERPK